MLAFSAGFLFHTVLAFLGCARCGGWEVSTLLVGPRPHFSRLFSLYLLALVADLCRLVALPQYVMFVFVALCSLSVW
jgi:hypothetical protein